TRRGWRLPSDGPTRRGREAARRLFSTSRAGARARRRQPPSTSEPFSPYRFASPAPIAHTFKVAGPIPPAQAQIALSVLTACGGVAVARLVREHAAGLPFRIQSRGTVE